jgi:hypothetical protein
VCFALQRRRRTRQAAPPPAARCGGRWCASRCSAVAAPGRQHPHLRRGVEGGGVLRAAAPAPHQAGSTPTCGAVWRAVVCFALTLKFMALILLRVALATSPPGDPSAAATAASWAERSAPNVVQQPGQGTGWPGTTHIALAAPPPAKAWNHLVQLGQLAVTDCGCNCAALNHVGLKPPLLLLLLLC